MHLRRTTALSVGSLLLAAPLLSSCGFNYATDRPNTVAAGANNRDGAVDVLGAVIVSAQDNSGTFIGALANNDQTHSVSFESLTGAGSDDVQAQSFSPRKIAPGGALNLSQEGGVPVTGTFKAGDVVSVSVVMDTGEKINLDVPVVADAGYFGGYDTSGSGSASPSGAASPSGEAKPSQGASPSGGTTPSGGASPTAAPTTPSAQGS
jgi:hypothetical protein